MSEGNVPQEASDNMLKEPNSLLLNKLGHHVAQHGSDRIEPLIRMADVA